MPRLGNHLFSRVRGVRDETVARDMAEFAEVFLEGAEEDDFPLDYTAGSADRLDVLAGMFCAGEPAEDTRNSMVMSMGAYLGELLVRTAGGRWVHDADQRMAAVELPGGERVLPHRAVHARLTGGPEAGLAGFYRSAAAT